MADHVNDEFRTRLILPFAISAEDRIKDFTKDMEMAAILYLMESNRKKGESHILKKPDEKLVFISEACYPIWLVPWRGGTLLFDGLGVTSHTISHDTVPDTKLFSKDIRDAAETSEAYSVALSRNAIYFKNFADKEENTIEGLIASPDFLQDFSSYLLEAKETDRSLATKSILTSTIDDYEISDSVEQLSNLRAKIFEDIENLDASMRLLSRTTREKIKAIQKEIKEVRGKFDEQIVKVKPGVARKIGQIHEEYDGRIAKISKRIERRLRLLHENQVKLERMKRHLRAEINRCEDKIKSFKRRKKKRSEIQRTMKLKGIKKRLPVIERKIKETIRKIESLESAKKLDISQQRVECDVCIENAKKILRDLEASRDVEIGRKRQEIKSIDETSSLIINQMNEMTQSKKAALDEFDMISLPQRKRAFTLVYLPFYIARFEVEAKKRYIVFPPSIVGDMGILTKMKGALGAAKMKAFLQPRSRAMTEFLNQFITLIQRSPMLEKEVTEAGIQDSVLQKKELRIGVKRGLKELEDENWISKKELQTFCRLLYIYA